MFRAGASLYSCHLSFEFVWDFVFRISSFCGNLHALPPMPRALVLSFDRLHPGYLGCYGNEWIETPNFDRLAIESIVFDRHFGENFDAAAANHAWWTGVYQHRLDHDAQRAMRSFAERLSDAGVGSRLWIESDGGIDSGVAPWFEDVRTVRGKDGLDSSDAETPFARLISTCVDDLAAAGESAPALVWLKSRGVPVPWLPPHELADLYLDEFGLADEPADEESEDEAADEDGSPESFETGDEPPPRRVPPLPEDVLYARALYAAYVTHVDRWLGKLWRFLNSSPVWKDALVVVTAAGGENLAEHGALGEDARRLFDEVTHAPLFVRVPGSPEAGSRRPALVQTVDIAPTLLEWFGTGFDAAAAGTASGQSLLPLVRGECSAVREAAWLGDGRGERAIRVHEFLFVAPPGARNGTAIESDAVDGLLFEKPYDRWDMSDVRAQYLHEADELQRRLKAWNG
jgi:arylsulfatase A-like enzyme